MDEQEGCTRLDRSPRVRPIRAVGHRARGSFVPLGSRHLRASGDSVATDRRQRNGIQCALSRLCVRRARETPVHISLRCRRLRAWGKRTVARGCHLDVDSIPADGETRLDEACASRFTTAPLAVAREGENVNLRTATTATGAVVATATGAYKVKNYYGARSAGHSDLCFAQGAHRKKDTFIGERNVAYSSLGHSLLWSFPPAGGGGGRHLSIAQVARPYALAELRSRSLSASQARYVETAKCLPSFATCDKLSPLSRTQGTTTVNSFGLASSSEYKQALLKEGD